MLSSFLCCRQTAHFGEKNRAGMKDFLPMVWLDLGQFCDTDISGKLQNAPACRQHWEGEAPAWITVKDHSGVVHVQQVWTARVHLPFGFSRWLCILSRGLMRTEI